MTTRSLSPATAFCDGPGWRTVPRVALTQDNVLDVFVLLEALMDIHADTIGRPQASLM